MVWFVALCWECFVVFLKCFTGNQHETCAAFFHFNWLINSELSYAICGIKNKVTNKLFQLIWILVCVAFVNCDLNLLPRNCFLWIWSTNNIHVITACGKVHHHQNVLWLKVNIAIDKNHVVVTTTNKLICQIVSSTLH